MCLQHITLARKRLGQELVEQVLLAPGGVVLQAFGVDAMCLGLDGTHLVFREQAPHHGVTVFPVVCYMVGPIDLGCCSHVGLLG